MILFQCISLGFDYEVNRIVVSYAVLARNLRDEPLKRYSRALTVEMGLQMLIDFSREHQTDHLPVLHPKNIEWLNRTVETFRHFNARW